MKQSIIILFLFAIQNIWAQNTEETVREVTRVIERFAGNVPVKLSLSIDKEEGRDVFEVVENEQGISIKGSSGVALCRGFYHSLKSKKAGICSWSGNRMDEAAFLNKNKNNTERVVSPFQHHYY